MAPKSKSGKWYAANKAGRDKKNRKQKIFIKNSSSKKRVDGIQATRKRGKAGAGKEWGHTNGKAGVKRQSKKSNRADTSTGGRRKGVKHAGHNKSNPASWGKRKR
jgi:hypothetical protein